MKKVVLITLLCIHTLHFIKLYAQDCDAYTLFMPNDTILCEPGSPVVLSPVFTGNIGSLSWSPSSGLDFPSLINPTATVSTSTTYELTIEAVAPENLIFNGDFSMGDVGFFSDYNYGNGGQYGILSDEGDYAIDDNAGDTHSNFADCDDHTGGGNMMVVNGSGQPDDVWCQNVSVQPNTFYNFSAWVATVISENPANLQFSINGILLGDQFDATLQTCVWQQFAETWFSGSNMNAQICIVNVNEETTGNDFALDDIAFSPVCTYTGQVTINVGSPPPPPVVSCSATTSSITLEWEVEPAADSYEVNVLNAPSGTLSGNTYTLDGLDPEQSVDFEVLSYGADGCTSTTVVSCTTEACPLLDIQFTAPAAICEGDTTDVLLSIAGAAGPFIATINDGVNELNFNIPAGTTAFSFAPMQSTSYQLTALTVVDAANCVINNLPSALTIEVNQAPVAGAGLPLEACEREENVIQLSDLLLMADPGGQWADLSATPIGTAFDPGAQTLDLSEIAGGSYQLEYSLTAEAGCMDASTTVELTIFNSPVADAGLDDVLNCTVEDLVLGGMQTSIADSLNYEWYTLSGPDIVSGDAPELFIDQPGTYILTVDENSHGCSDADTVIISQSITTPEIFATAVEGGCGSAGDGSIQIDSVAQAALPYSFSLNGGTLSSTEVFNGLPSGNYSLEVIDGNGCRDEIMLLLNEGNDLEASLQSSGTNRIFSGESTTLTILLNRAESEIVSVEWFPLPENCDNCLSATFTPAKTQTYQVVVEDVNGCKTTTSITVEVEQRSRYFIPTAFSPNDDGRNDTLYPFTGPEFDLVTYWVIMDRWGNMVYRRQNFPANNPDFAWDGNIRGEPAAAGVYAYFMLLRYPNGENLEISGEVNLVR
jgi:gliding motility-associated-like protein